MNFDESFQTALSHHRAGRLPEAELLYRQIVAADPGHADSLHMLGMICHQTGRIEFARKYIAQFVALRPDAADGYANLGLVLQARGELENAVKCYQKAIELSPKESEFHNRLGVVLKAQGKLDEAIDSLKKAVELDAGNVAAVNNLGNAYRAQGRRDEAMAAYRKVLAVQPDHVEALNNLGNCLRESGAMNEAIALYRHALSLHPDHREILAHLATALEEAGELHEAIACYRHLNSLAPNAIDVSIRLGNALVKAGAPGEAIPIYSWAASLDPSSATAHFNLGCALQLDGKPDEAIASFRQTLALEPTFAAAANNLGSALKDIARLDEALEAFAQALKIQPDYREAADNIIYTQLFHPGIDRRQQADELRRWRDQYAPPVASPRREKTSQSTSGRRIRIGYVSPDFRDHVVGRNVLPVLRHHDRSRFEIFCYSNVQRSDAMTLQFRAAADHWRDITLLSDTEAAEIIAGDGIDILVDLALHLAFNRLPIFAHKPAPVQMTWAGYPGTTGLDTIDYRITDPYLDPPGINAELYNSERSIRLPHSFWCYDPLGMDIAVNTLPAGTSGPITFGCLNNFCKVNAPTLQLWGDLLVAVPDSMLHLLAPEGSARQGITDALAARNIAVDRIVFHGVQPRSEYLNLYHQIDIALDTVPYNGHTTSLDALWMGVPLLTIAGNSPVSRAGVSQLSNIGLMELIAGSATKFVEIGMALANDRARLASLRASLRSRLEQSPIMDVRGFIADLETLFVAWASRPC